MTARAARTAGPALLMIVGAALFLSVSGAFGGDDIPLLQRFGLWVTLLLAGGATFQAVTHLMARWAPFGRWPRAAAVLVVTTALVTLEVWLLTALWLEGGAPGGPPGWGLAAAVGTVTVAMTALAALIGARGSQAKIKKAGGSAAAVLRRASPRVRAGELEALSAEGHYLRIHTSAGSDLILMPLADAVAQLEGFEGAQTHRSWWVAKAAVARVKRDGSGVRLVLKSGAEAPVSRRRAAELGRAGWF